jgi:hypothetical protein
MTSKDTVESARRFLWDEEGDASNSRPSSAAASGRFTGGRGGDHVDQSVNLMAMGDTSPASGARGGIIGGVGGGSGAGGGSDAELGGASSSSSSSSAVMHRVSGLFRTGTSSRPTTQGATTATSASTDPRLDEYGDASPSTEAEEYLDNDKHHRRRINPIIASLFGTWNTCLESCAMTYGRIGLPKLCVLVAGSVLLLVLAVLGWNFAADKGTIGGGSGSGGSREALVMERILNAGISTQSALTVAKTPQQLALQWIVKDDAAQLPTTHDNLLERYILAVFYYSTNGKSGGWTTDENWLSDQGICSWYGVRCVPIENTAPSVAGQPTTTLIESYDENAAVIKLELPENKMEGTLPAELMGLSSLASLDLSSNELSGGIPTALGKMFAIKNINLRQNKIVGPIPSELGQLSNTLHTLQVGMNQLTGKSVVVSSR